MSSIRQEVMFKTTPEKLYMALTDARQFSAFTGGAPTEIRSEVGGAFSCFGGMISGINIELVPNQRIVQAWRAGNWEPGVHSIVRFELNGQGGETRLVFEHSGFPVDQREHLDGGWKKMYWAPLQKYLA